VAGHLIGIARTYVAGSVHHRAAWQGLGGGPPPRWRGGGALAEVRKGCSGARGVRPQGRRAAVQWGWQHDCAADPTPHHPPQARAARPARLGSPAPWGAHSARLLGLSYSLPERVAQQLCRPVRLWGCCAGPVSQAQPGTRRRALCAPGRSAFSALAGGPAALTARALLSGARLSFAGMAVCQAWQVPNQLMTRGASLPAQLLGMFLGRPRASSSVECTLVSVRSPG